MTAAQKNDDGAHVDYVDFGTADIPKHEKAARVAAVFQSVASYYDVMNDVMSLGAHRWWKTFAIALLDIRPTMRVLDIAGGSGDLTSRATARTPHVVLSDINPAMLARARQHDVPAVCCDGEALPFASRSFDRTINAFGLRNMTDRARAIAESARVLKVGGLCGVLEFAPPSAAVYPRSYHAILTRILPVLGRAVANDAASYRYLGESIVRMDAPATVCGWFVAAGLAGVRHYALAGGAVSFYLGRRLH